MTFDQAIFAADATTEGMTLVLDILDRALLTIEAQHPVTPQELLDLRAYERRLRRVAAEWRATLNAHHVTARRALVETTHMVRH